MASVSSLDQDMRKLRMDRYTPEAAGEVRSWIENTLGEKLPLGDLLDALKDGVALCKLANLVLPQPGIKYKASAMPFVQRENISRFLTACEMPPMNMPSHDRFLTVDLYDSKDGAQVLQCLSAFSRSANAVNPSRFPQVIGPKRASSPTRRAVNGGSVGSSADLNRRRGASNASQHSDGPLSPALSGRAGTPTGVMSSWSKRSDEAVTAPAWNIHQYGYMGGASQGNLGVSFGARRQITSPSVDVPSPAEKNRRLKEQKEEAERTRQQAQEEERKLLAQHEVEEEDQRREEEAHQEREKERLQVEEEKRRWKEEERHWKEEEECRMKEENLEQKPALRTEPDTHNLRGKFLSQNQSEDSPRRVSESERIRELERQLEEAKERERQYQLERERRNQSPEPQPRQSYRRPQSVMSEAAAQLVDENSNEKEELRQEWDKQQEREPAAPASRVLPERTNSSFKTPPKLATKPAAFASLRISSQANVPTFPTPPITTSQAPLSPTSPLPRPLPDPTPYFTTTPPTNPANPATRTDQFLATNAAPIVTKPNSYFPTEMGMTSTSELASEDARRDDSQVKTKAGGWASKSLLEREMELERMRQKEWEGEMLKRRGGARTGGLIGPRELPQKR